MSVLHSNCNYLDIDADVSKGSIPAKKHPSCPSFLIITPIIIILPLFIIWGYSEVLKALNLSITSISTMVGSIISAILTSLTTLYVTKKKL